MFGAVAVSVGVVVVVLVAGKETVLAFGIDGAEDNGVISASAGVVNEEIVLLLVAAIFLPRMEDSSSFRIAQTT